MKRSLDTGVEVDNNEVKKNQRHTTSKKPNMCKDINKALVWVLLFRLNWYLPYNYQSDSNNNSIQWIANENTNWAHTFHSTVKRPGLFVVSLKFSMSSGESTGSVKTKRIKDCQNPLKKHVSAYEHTNYTNCVNKHDLIIPLNNKKIDK